MTKEAEDEHESPTSGMELKALCQPAASTPDNYFPSVCVCPRSLLQNPSTPLSKLLRSTSQNPVNILADPQQCRQNTFTVRCQTPSEPSASSKTTSQVKQLPKPLITHSFDPPLRTTPQNHLFFVGAWVPVPLVFLVTRSRRVFAVGPRNMMSGMRKLVLERNSRGTMVALWSVRWFCQCRCRCKCRCRAHHAEICSVLCVFNMFSLTVFIQGCSAQ